jgi:hypothetical protein
MKTRYNMNRRHGSRKDMKTMAGGYIYQGVAPGIRSA